MAAAHPGPPLELQARPDVVDRRGDERVLLDAAEPAHEGGLDLLRTLPLAQPVGEEGIERDVRFEQRGEGGEVARGQVRRNTSAIETDCTGGGGGWWSCVRLYGDAASTDIGRPSPFSRWPAFARTNRARSRDGVFGAVLGQPGGSMAGASGRRTIQEPSCPGASNASPTPTSASSGVMVNRGTAARSAATGCSSGR